MNSFLYSKVLTESKQHLKIKNILLLFLLLSLSHANAQYVNGSINYANGTSKKGLVKITNNFKVKFKAKSEDKPSTHDHEDITGIDTHDDGNYRFKKYQEGFPPMLFQELKTGKMNLYIIERYNPGVMNQNGMMMGGGPSITYYIETFGKFIKLGARVKQKHLYHFSACRGLVDKIKKKEFKKNDIYGIVAFYNLHYYDKE